MRRLLELQKVKASNATLVGITESKLDKSINHCEISIGRYNITKRDRNRKRGGVACYAGAVVIKFVITLKNVFQTKEKIFLLSFFSRKQNQLLLE